MDERLFNHRYNSMIASIYDFFQKYGFSITICLCTYLICLSSFWMLLSIYHAGK